MVDSCGKLQDKHGEDVAKVTSARGNELHLEKLRHLASQEKWVERIQLLKRKEHFIFTIQSAAMQQPDILFCRALDHLSEKCDMLLARI
jgi:DNA-directed RNA polymerase I and III subunit RPAC1